MIPLLVRAGARYHSRHRWQLALAVLGVALGVAVVVAVDVATGSARRALELSTTAVSGRATHEIVGGPAGVPDSVYDRLFGEVAPHVALAPVIDRHVRLPAHANRVLRLLGVDPFAERPFRSYVGGAAAAAPELGVLLARRSLLLERATAASLGLATGDTLRVQFGTRTSVAEIGGVFDAADDLSRSALADAALADIATAQELTGGFGTIDRIDVRLDMEGVSGTAAVPGVTLPAGLRVVETAARTGATARLSDAFETNLTALALVALVFGLFLIYNSVAFSVVQRRPLLGLLRAQGVTARELFSLILLEAALLGAVATLLGIGGGLALGTQLVRLVARTINDLYFAVNVSALRLDALTFVKAALLGVCGTLAAAVPAAVEALHVPPRAALARAVLERRTRRQAPRLAAGGLACALLAAGLLLAPTRSVTLGFAALFVLVLAGALLTPAATMLLMRMLRPVAGLTGVIGRMATRGVTASLSRTAPAIAALGVALAVGIAVAVMIDSFRSGVVRWLDRTLQADIYIAAPDVGANRSLATLPAGLADQVRGVPGVTGVSTYRQLSLLADPVSRAEPADLVRLFAFDPFEQHRAAFEMLDVEPAAGWRGFDRGGVLISEPLAWRRGIGAGDTIVLPTDRGAASFPVAGVYRDYATEHGVVFMARGTYESWWRDRALTSVAVFVRDDADAAAVLERIRGLPAAGGTIVRLDRGLRAATLEVFDRTFLITGVLRLLALIVAFVGVTGALMALQLERSREIGVLRATGLTPLQVWSLITSQTALMGAAAAALAVPLGIAMSWAMVHVINRRSFGWTFDLLIGAGPFVQALAAGVGAAVLAGLYPALRMSRLRPAQALREE
ncbi:MAG TPA: FtsX-like permease family protein [Longimicrobiales bacterium]